MPRYIYRNEDKINYWKIVAIILFIILEIFAVKLIKEESYNEGYNDAYNTGQADGWQGCIEENNLYERYAKNEK